MPTPVFNYKTNLHTTGGEYRNPDGSEYIGDYHIDLNTSGDEIAYTLSSHSDWELKLTSINTSNFENLYTFGGEYVTEDNLDYIGYYHQDYKDGQSIVMSGQFHTNANNEARLFSVGDGVFPISIEKTHTTDISNDSIVDNHIEELLQEDEIDVLFRMYDNLKADILPGTISRNINNKIELENLAEYKTHAYLVANSKNFLTGESLLYSIDEINLLLIQNENLRAKVSELTQMNMTLNSIINNYSGTLSDLNTLMSQFMSNQNNTEIYSKSLVNMVSGSFELAKNITKDLESIITVGKLPIESSTASSNQDKR